MAKAYASDAFRKIAGAGIQLHGGIGFTWEHDLHLYFKRAKSSEFTFGDASYHRERVAQLISCCRWGASNGPPKPPTLRAPAEPWRSASVVDRGPPSPALPPA